MSHAWPGSIPAKPSKAKNKWRINEAPGTTPASCAGSGTEPGACDRSLFVCKPRPGPHRTPMPGGRTLLGWGYGRMGRHSSPVGLRFERPLTMHQPPSPAEEKAGKAMPFHGFRGQAGHSLPLAWAGNRRWKPVSAPHLVCKDLSALALLPSGLPGPESSRA